MIRIWKFLSWPEVLSVIFLKGTWSQHSSFFLLSTKSLAPLNTLLISNYCFHLWHLGTQIIREKWRQWLWLLPAEHGCFRALDSFCLLSGPSSRGRCGPMECSVGLFQHGQVLTCWYPHCIIIWILVCCILEETNLTSRLRVEAKDQKENYCNEAT